MVITGLVITTLCLINLFTFWMAWGHREEVRRIHKEIRQFEQELIRLASQRKRRF